ncbi:MAG: hypothetical protein GEV04_23500 [Actinophytocola sp.]|nr:hypothetical protein [Actinophytocola sp.]
MTSGNGNRSLLDELDATATVTAPSARSRRVQLSRRAGWRLPPNTRSVAYSSRFANPYRPPAARTVEANAAAVEQYRARLRAHPALVTGEVGAGKTVAVRAALAGAHDLSLVVRRVGQPARCGR